MSRKREEEYLRELASRVMEIARGRENDEAAERWRAVNGLRKPDRPPVWCKPVGAWKEILPPQSFSCSDPFLRSMENYFRRVLVKHDIGDDSIVPPFFPVAAVFSVDPPNTWGVEVKRHDPGEEGGAWKYDPPLKTEADLEKLRMPAFRYEKEKTEELASRASEVLGGVMEPRVVCSPPLDGTLCTYAADLMGLNDLMVNLIDKPDTVHRLMGYLRDAVLAAMEYVEREGILTPNNDAPMTCSDPVGPDPGKGPLRLENLWTMVNSQEFDQVSPGMWREFLLAYQLPILERFGLSAYGCCENLTHKIDDVLAIPNLRIFVCSAWTDLDTVVEKVGRDFVIMWREKATRVVFSEDMKPIRAKLDEDLRKMKGCFVQIVLRELQTLSGRGVERLRAWTEAAKEAGAKYA